MNMPGRMKMTTQVLISAPLASSRQMDRMMSICEYTATPNVAAKNEHNADDNTYAVFKNPLYGNCLLVFNPNEDIINAMRPHMNSDLVKQLYYTKK